MPLISGVGMLWVGCYIFSLLSSQTENWCRSHAFSITGSGLAPLWGSGAEVRMDQVICWFILSSFKKHLLMLVKWGSRPCTRPWGDNSKQDFQLGRESAQRSRAVCTYYGMGLWSLRKMGNAQKRPLVWDIIWSQLSGEWVESVFRNTVSWRHRLSTEW